MKSIKKAIRELIRCRFHSIKASTNGTTYDRYDPKFGLHSK
ncbi:hypothetical protein bux_106 [Salmonella phage bux]|uniref:Uncharacterized protein n=1 Tax=Salmonella phage bux TaxID=2713288 RepID=A0A6G9LAG7_9CAUD|nr:hypothetical protein bux_106 [Salmonella phage bux]